MRRRLAIAFLVVVLSASCGESSDKSDAPPIGEAPLRVGQVMVETGHRFEMSGRARQAGRWDLAAYEAHEIVELFEADLSRALLPDECTDEVSEAMFSLLLDEQLPALRAAADAHDGAAYDTAFDTASRSCNACHTTCEVTFVSVPNRPGMEVPRMSPLTESSDAPVVDPAPTPAP